MHTRTLSCLLALSLAACGGSSGAPTGVKLSAGAAKLTIVSGDHQTAAPTDTLPFLLDLVLTRNGSPVPNQLVQCTIVEDNAGTCFQTSVQTDSVGHVYDRVIAGTHAYTRPNGGGTFHWRFQYIDQQNGDAVVAAEGSYTVLPGAADSVVRNIGYTLQPSPFTIPAGVVKDQYGNPVPFAAHNADTLVTADSATLTFASPGCGPFPVTVADTTVLYGMVVAGGNVPFTFTSSDPNHVGYWTFRADGTTRLSVTLVADSADISPQNGLYPCWHGVIAPGDTAWMAR